jgi:small subunit ribosomal protein S20
VANHKQAAKRARRNERRKHRNIGIKTRVKSAVRAFREAADGTDKEAAAKAFRHAAKQLRTAASKGVMHARTASRRVSRLSRAFDKLEG